MNSFKITPEFSFPRSLWNQEGQSIFTPELIQLLIQLHNEFSDERSILLNQRTERQKSYNSGSLPTFLDQTSQAVKGDWQVSPLPPELLCRRVEITGPVHSSKMVINMLNRNPEGSRADMAMLDFEDSMKPSFFNVLSGYQNVLGAVVGDLKLTTDEKIMQITPHDSAYVMVRCRGLHLTESNVKINGEPISAGLLDLAVCFFHTAKIYLAQNKTPKYYIPKCEHYLEARWWNKLFIALEVFFKMPVGTLKATFLIETLPAAFQVEEILYEIKDHAAGLNVGRWDKIFSDIKVLRFHPSRVLADRDLITMQKSWMENYAKRVIAICHDRGALAIGGMSAFTPGKSQSQREEQTIKVLEDKQREASWGHDGCWVSHPYFIGCALSAFKFDNQLHLKLSDFNKFPDLLPQGGGPYTMAGLRTNIRVAIAYLHGWNHGHGCIALDNKMEDLATLEISRAQIWQWNHYQVMLEEGLKVNQELIRLTFDQELIKLASEMDIPVEDLLPARNQAQELFLKQNLSEFMCSASEII